MGVFQETSLLWLFSASITKLSHITRLYNNSVSHLNGSSVLRCLTLINNGDWSRSALTRGWRMHRGALLHAFGVFMQLRMRCNLTIAPNIGELSLVSAIGPLLEWNFPVFLMARRSRGGPPRPLGPMHSVTLFPPLATPLVVCTGGSSVQKIQQMNALKTQMDKIKFQWWLQRICLRTNVHAKFYVILVIYL